MTDAEKQNLLVRGVAVSSSSSRWTLLGTSELNAAESVELARGASARLSAWTTTALTGAETTSVVFAERIEGEPLAPAKKARQVNGVSKALSPEYREIFGALSADFITVGSALLKSATDRK